MLREALVGKERQVLLEGKVLMVQQGPLGRWVSQAGLEQWDPQGQRGDKEQLENRV